MNQQEFKLALVKALNELAEQVEELAKSNEGHASDPHYKSYYQGARDAGADHRTAHKNAKAHAAKMKNPGPIGGMTSEQHRQNYESHTTPQQREEHSRQAGEDMVRRKKLK